MNHQTSTTLPTSDTPHSSPPPTLELETASALIAAAALRPSPVGPVGLELEGHVHDRLDPLAPIDFARLTSVADPATPLPGGGRVTFEPGGQVEVSSAVHPDVGAAIAATRADVAVVRARLAALDLVWTHLGADPWRPPRRINPHPRYAGMEAWFDAVSLGGGRPGRTMMCATAALQINLEAGPVEQWPARVGRATALGPLLTALTGSSRLLAGRDTGAHSSRQQAWSAMDPGVAGPVPVTDDPVAAWTESVLAAPVVHLDGPGGLRPAGRRRSLADWLTDPLDWPEPTVADVHRHLTTRFPPLRLRGFLELRCLDALPEPWWPAVVAAVVVWMDDPRAAAVVDAALAPVTDRWSEASARGLADAPLARAAVSCLEAAVDLAEVEGADRAALAELLRLARSGRSPGVLLADELLATADYRTGPRS